MALTIITDPADAPIEPLRGRTIAVLGFGNQGAAHAMNLRDSGLEVIVANRPDSPNGRRALACGFPPLSLEEATGRADLLVMALPDEAHADLWTERIEPHLRAGAIVGFLHGFSIRYGQVRPPRETGVIMVAPKGPGRTLRDRFEAGEGIPCLFAVHQEAPEGSALPAEAAGLAWAHGLGCARAAIVYTTFADETETDLFGEQAVLCGGMSALIVAAFEILVESGYSPELAYLECCQEVRQVADLVYEGGLAAMMSAISNTAEFGAHAAGPVLVDDDVRARMRALLERVRDGSFAVTLADDHRRGFPWFARRRRQLAEHAIERAGREVRSWMPWLTGARPGPTEDRYPPPAGVARF